MENPSNMTGEEIVEHFSSQREPQPRKRRLRNLPFFIGAVFVFGFAFIYASQFNVSAKEILIREISKSCRRYDERATDCYRAPDHKKRDLCAKKDAAEVWFAGEYGVTPDYACSTPSNELDFLEIGLK